MKILIIGGTKFLGRHLVRAAQAKDHEVTLFNRGKFTRETFAGVEQIRGDRNQDLDKLKNHQWDAVIDTCGYLPQTVAASAQFLWDSVGQYVFISSISAYRDFRRVNFDETAPLARLTAEQKRKVAQIDPRNELTGIVLGEMYGALKALCEAEAESAMPGRVLNVRSGLIVGEHDWTDRFTYWVMRGAQGGKILAPADPHNFIQFIDARDLSEWVVKMIAGRETGTFNVTGRPFELTFGTFLQQVKDVTESDADYIWASEEFLKNESVAPWSEMPLYLPGSEKGWRGFLSANIDRALAKGLTFRPLSETIRDTRDWRKTVKRKLKAGITRKRESELLRKWRRQR
jgi:2'-hydroxyisoflavone reductase